MRRPGSNECLQDKPRNRHFAEWRFLPLIRTVTVNPKIWNVIVIGMSLTSLPEDTVTNRLPYSFGALGVIRPYSSYQKPPILSILAAEPLRLAPLGTSP